MKHLSLQLWMSASDTTVQDSEESQHVMNAILWFFNDPTHQIQDDDDAEALCVAS